RRTRSGRVRSTRGRRLALPTLLRRAFADGNLDIHVLVVAAQPDRGTLSRDEGRHQVQHRVRILDRLTLDRNQDVAGLQPRPFGGSAPQYALDQDPRGGSQAEGLAHFRSDLPRLDTDPTARHAAGLDD